MTKNECRAIAILANKLCVSKKRILAMSIYERNMYFNAMHIGNAVYGNALNEQYGKNKTYYGTTKNRGDNTEENYKFDKIDKRTGFFKPRIETKILVGETYSETNEMIAERAEHYRKNNYKTQFDERHEIRYHPEHSTTNNRIPNAVRDAVLVDDNGQIME